MALKKEETWVGFGLVGGGSLIAVGTEGLEGAMISCDRKKKVLVDKMAVRLGPGLGAGTGVCMLIGVHAPTYSAIKKVKRMDGWDANLSVFAKVNAKSAKTVISAARIAARTRLQDMMKVLTPDTVESMFDGAKLMYEASQGTEKLATGKPDIAAISLPVGVGLEASAHYTIGFCEVKPWADVEWDWNPLW